MYTSRTTIIAPLREWIGFIRGPTNVLDFRGFDTFAEPFVPRSASPNYSLDQRRAEAFVENRAKIFFSSRVFPFLSWRHVTTHTRVKGVLEAVGWRSTVTIPRLSYRETRIPASDRELNLVIANSMNHFESVYPRATLRLLYLVTRRYHYHC